MKAARSLGKLFGALAAGGLLALVTPALGQVYLGGGGGTGLLTMNNTWTGTNAFSSMTFLAASNPGVSTFYINNDGVGDFNFQAGSSGSFHFVVNGSLVASIGSTGLIGAPVGVALTNTHVGLTDISDGAHIINPGQVLSRDWGIYSDVADAAGDVGVRINNSTSLTATSKALLDVENNGTDEFIVRPTTGIAIASTVAPAGADFGIGGASGAFIFNTPSGDQFNFNQNGTNMIDLQFSGATAEFVNQDTGDINFWPKATQALNLDSVLVTSLVTFTSNSTKNRGTIGLSGGTGTATILSGAVCNCTDVTTFANLTSCSPSGTTLTATASGASDNINYICLGP